MQSRRRRILFVLCAGDCYLLLCFCTCIVVRDILGACFRTSRTFSVFSMTWEYLTVFAWYYTPEFCKMRYHVVLRLLSHHIWCFGHVVWRIFWIPFGWLTAVLYEVMSATSAPLILIPGATWLTNVLLFYSYICDGSVVTGLHITWNGRIIRASQETAQFHA